MPVRRAFGGRGHETLAANMFEITGEDIAALNDEDLRTLVGLLCEAEMRRLSRPVSAVTWGGNQNAPDGGIDVRVELPAGTAISGFIPRSSTGFQVKKPDMPAAEITKEMRPKPAEVLRPSIVALARVSGAYVIVSSTGSTAESALDDRKTAMRDAVADVPEAANLELDFLDRGRMATWVRDHAGMIPWVRSRVGRAIAGWQGYGSWSRAPEGAARTFLADDGARVKTGISGEEDGISVVDGINRTRNVLRSSSRVVRLVGLSGVGKTRFVEALFDPTIGAECLDPAQAVYADVADNPNPQPTTLADDLIAKSARAIMIIDNCPPKTHRRLSEIVRGAGSTISLITIEYDIKEDEPEGTDVFTLDAASADLIEKLVQARFPHVSQIDAATIAEFSGGNARVALALAQTVERDGSVAGLNDRELFRRLFEQRNNPDKTLQSIAEACSLVYSFNAEDGEGAHAELSILGGLVGKTADDIYPALVDLKRRDLLQARGPWRAVLPHAIANRLAANALENIMRRRVLSALVENAPDRLARSFSRRLGYLDRSREAREIVGAWLAPGGLLSDVANHNDLGRAMFSNIAPVAPEAALSTLECALGTVDEDVLRRCSHYTHVLRSIAYDAAYFERATTLLLRFAHLPGRSHESGDAANMFESLFHIVLSGTHASLDMRLSVIERLIVSHDSRDRELGVKALRAVIQTSHFDSRYTFEFGARSRDYGFHPRNPAEAKAWFASALRFATPLAVGSSEVSAEVRDALAHEFRGLWMDGGQQEELENIARAIAQRQFWAKGWMAVRSIIAFNREELAREDLRRLEAIEELLRPHDLITRVRGTVIECDSGIDPEDLADEERDYVVVTERASRNAEDLGRACAIDEGAFMHLLPELVGSYGPRTISFGRGLALAASNPQRIWEEMTARFGQADRPQLLLMGGFLEGLRTVDEALTEAFLEGALVNPILEAWFPAIQSIAPLDSQALSRLHRSLNRGVAPIERFGSLAHGTVCDNLPAPDFRDFVVAINRQPGGNRSASRIVSMRIFTDDRDRRPHAPEVIEAGQVVLSSLTFQRTANPDVMEDHDLSLIAKGCLDGIPGQAVAAYIGRELVQASLRWNSHLTSFDDLISALFASQPLEMLDQVLGQSEQCREAGARLLSDLLRRDKSPLEEVPAEILLGWCDQEPAVRYPLVAKAVLLFRRPQEHKPQEWTPITRRLLACAPNPIEVHAQIVDRMWPTSWHGSRSAKIESRIQLLEQLDVSDVPRLELPQAEAIQRLRETAAYERERETAEERERSARFE